MNLKSQLQHYINHPELPVDPDWVDSMAEAYPYYTAPAIMMFSRDTSGIDPKRLQAIGNRLRLNTPDPERLFEQLDPDAAQWVSLYPSEAPTPTTTTDEAIDRFINTYGHQSPEEDALLERLIFNPTPDYAQMLEHEQASNQPRPGEAAPGSQDDLINAFILKNTPPVPADTTAKPNIETVEAPARPKVQAPTDIPADASLTEGLARVYIQQHRYDRAFEILRAISLNNPEKSIYFADQLRFLKKLIINQRHIDKRSTHNN